jgi:alkanesulfonate monooxygenase SsuD/methylene tetrahydromethanopterin reductase-like flavin-dependent oxidoreductase (luciferase family)
MMQLGVHSANCAVEPRPGGLGATLRICLQMWGPDNGSFAGRHYQLAETLCVPAPVHQPRPPIMINGTGEKKTLRLVATYVDASDTFALAAKLDTLARVT